MPYNIFMNQNNGIDPNKIIDRLGGTSATARLCEIEPASVSEWRTKGIPKARVLYLKAIRPDAFEPENRRKQDAA